MRLNLSHPIALLVIAAVHFAASFIYYIYDNPFVSGGFFGMGLLLLFILGFIIMPNHMLTRGLQLEKRRLKQTDREATEIEP